MQSFDVPVKELEGGVGEGITSGTGEEIVWTITQDATLHQLEVPLTILSGRSSFTIGRGLLADFNKYECGFHESLLWNQ